MKYSILAKTIFLLVCSLVLTPTVQAANSNWARNYWGRSNGIQEKIEALSGTVVASVPVPILFGVGLKNISPNFGDPRSGGRSHEGEDIMAVKGTPIISPTDAVVLRTGEGPTEGLYVYTANPGGETFVYMHLDRIGEGVEPGTALTRGSLIGYVGNTGNASGGAAHLHFEIHDNGGDPTDPYPRITTEFTVTEKMIALEAILLKTTDSAALAEFLVSNFKSTFTSAQTAGNTIPPAITQALGAATTNALPQSDLAQGSTGGLVVTLQKFLIQANAGASARQLAAAGATGNFGPLTRAAVAEYQGSIGIPVTGVYDSAMRISISNPSTPTPQPTITTPTPTSVISGTQFTRNLARNMSDVDVRTLQQILNAQGFIVAASGAGSPGNETLYFGTATEAAVKKFQAAQGISPISGYVGPLTRTALNSLVN